MFLWSGVCPQAFYCLGWLQGQTGEIRAHWLDQTLHPLTWKLPTSFLLSLYLIVILPFMSKLLSDVQLFATPWIIQSMEFSRPDYWSGWSFSSPGDLPNPEIKPRSPALWVDSLAAEPQVKPKNTGVGSLSLFQRIFPTQESNWGLLHCRQILY